MSALPSIPTEDEIFLFLRRKYAQASDERQKEMGLSYTTVETRDLAREIHRYIARYISAPVPMREGFAAGFEDSDGDMGFFAGMFSTVEEIERESPPDGGHGRTAYIVYFDDGAAYKIARWNTSSLKWE